MSNRAIIVDLQAQNAALSNENAKYRQENENLQQKLAALADRLQRSAKYLERPASMQGLRQGHGNLKNDDDSMSSSSPECPICKCDFTNPVATPCGHLFCHQCFFACANVSPEVTCPFCREPTEVKSVINVYGIGTRTNNNSTNQNKRNKKYMSSKFQYLTLASLITLTLIAIIIDYFKFQGIIVESFLSTILKTPKRYLHFTQSISNLLVASFDKYFLRFIFEYHRNGLVSDFFKMIGTALSYSIMSLPAIASSPIYFFTFALYVLQKELLAIERICDVYTSGFYTSFISEANRNNNDIVKLVLGGADDLFGDFLSGYCEAPPSLFTWFSPIPCHLECTVEVFNIFICFVVVAVFMLFALLLGFQINIRNNRTISWGMWILWIVSLFSVFSHSHVIEFLTLLDKWIKEQEIVE